MLGLGKEPGLALIGGEECLQAQKVVGVLWAWLSGSLKCSQSPVSTATSVTFVSCFRVPRLPHVLFLENSNDPF